VHRSEAFTGREGEVLKFISAALPPRDDGAEGRGLKKCGPWRGLGARPARARASSCAHFA
jgi:hypothetical protein